MYVHCAWWAHNKRLSCPWRSSRAFQKWQNNADTVKLGSAVSPAHLVIQLPSHSHTLVYTPLLSCWKAATTQPRLHLWIIDVHTHRCTHMHTHTHTHAHTCTHVHARTQMHTHAHIHTHTHTCRHAHTSVTRRPILPLWSFYFWL